MAIITISRQLAVLGDETAQELAKSLNYRFVDKTVLEERIKSYGIAGQKFEKYDERRPSFWASLSQDRDDYLHYLKTAMLNEAVEGDCIFIGRGANIIFRGIPGVVSAFLVAPYEIRLERVKSYFQCDEKRARQILEQSDHDRSGFHRYFFDNEWKDPANYHITLNTGSQAPAICAQAIKYLRDATLTPETEGLQAERLKELILGQQVTHHILYDRGISIHFMETLVSRGKIQLYGVANSQALVEAAINAAKEVAPGGTIQSDIQVVQEFNVIP